MSRVKLLMVLTENETLVGPRDLHGLVDVAVTAEASGIDGVMMSEPQGPVYTCYDASMLEEAMPHAVALPPVKTARVPTRSSSALAYCADTLTVSASAAQI